MYIFSWWSDREEIKVTDGIKADIWREYDPGGREHVRCWKKHPTTGKYFWKILAPNENSHPVEKNPGDKIESGVEIVGLNSKSMQELAALEEKNIIDC